MSDTFQLSRTNVRAFNYSTKSIIEGCAKYALKTSLNRIVERVSLFSFLFHYNFNISEALKIWYIKIKKALSVT